MLRDWRRRFHPWHGDGELMTVNAALAAQTLPITLSTPMAAMLRQSVKYAESGLLNPASGNLRALWGFYDDIPPFAPPTEAEIHAWLENAPHVRDIHMQGNVIMAAPANTRFDFDDIAQGAMLDAAREVLRQYGIRHAFIEIGSSALAMGKNGKRRWRTVLRPQDRPLGFLYLEDGEAVTTASTAKRLLALGGESYHYIFNVQSGQPASAAAAAIAVSSDADHPGAVSAAAAAVLVVADDAQADSMMKNFNISAAWRHSTGATPALRKRLFPLPRIQKSIMSATRMAKMPPTNIKNFRLYKGA